MSQDHPYSVRRLLSMIRSHDFSTECDSDGEDKKTCEPLNARAYQRIKKALAQRREQRDAEYDPLFDEEKAEFNVCDVAILQDEVRHLR